MSEWLWYDETCKSRKELRELCRQLGVLAQGCDLVGLSMAKKLHKITDRIFDIERALHLTIGEHVGAFEKEIAE